jgi:trimeric autotransporter adhesin
MKTVLYRVLWCSLLAVGLQATRAEAVVVPQKDAVLAEKSFRQAELNVPEVNQPLSEIPALAAGLQGDLTTLGVNPDQGFYDSRSGRWSSLILTTPLVPGTGFGNNLRWVDLGASRPLDDAAMKAQVWTALTGWLEHHRAQLRVDQAELGAPRLTITDGGALIQVHVPRVVAGVPVRDSGLTAIINHGNLVLFGLQNWADVEALAVAAVAPEHARTVAAAHASPFPVTTWLRGQQLEFVPTLRDGRYEFKLAWSVRLRVAGDGGTWEALVDAGSGDLLAFQDKNQYATRRIVGGVFPVSNDGRGPEGTEQPAQPMPFANVVIGANTIFSSTGGTLGCSTGSGNTNLAGRFVKMTDNCGAVNETATGDFDLGVSSGTDCVVPSGHSAGDTHSSRSGYYELNRIVEQAKGYQPNNAWLNNQLNSNMNIALSCNAFWDGVNVNFYRDQGSQCRNTGEIAAIFDHEWGHGFDNNGTNTNISNPGESNADIVATMRLNNSCVGRGFFKNQTCGGYGDPCIGTPTTGCTGVRDADFAQHVSGLPHGITWIRSNCDIGTGSGPCTGEVHCEGQPVSEIAWDLKARDLQAAPFNFDNNTALELTTRMFHLGSQTVTNWYTCAAGCETTGTCGCGATGGYLLVLAVDDDNGNINDGTPHMQAIRTAFNRHQMACNTPAVVNSGCAGGPTTAPTVTATAVDGGVNLSWTTVPNAARYAVFRAEGALGCNFGKVKIGETTGTTFSDTSLLNGRAYSYVVLPVGSNAACFGLSSACVTATPAPGPNLAIRPTITVTIVGGDGDDFVDNCEAATINFQVDNIGAVPLTNVRLVSVTPITHPTTIVTTPLPAPIAATLADCAAGNGAVTVTPQGMTFNQSSQFMLAVTSDELSPATRTQIVTVTNVESDYVNSATRTFNFDTDFDSWVVQQGTWTRAAGGAGGTPFHLSSSENLAFQCDVIRSPLVRLAANSTLTLQNNFQIEPTDPTNGPYDRVNVGVLDQLLGTRTVISPSSGTTYTVPQAPTPLYAECQLGGQAGWNATSPGYPAFAASNWTSAALNPGGVFTGRRAQLEIRYGTDFGLHLEGFDFDQVTLTNVDVQGPDTQNNTCAAQAAEANGITVDAGGNGVLQPNEAPVAVAPRWRNIGTAAITLTGAATNFTGPSGPTYTIADAAASYGTIAVGGTQACTDCYSMGVTAASRPIQHWDSTFLETVNPSNTTKTWTLHVGDSFTDVQASSGFYRFIETLFHRGVTGGCATNQYCPTTATTREQMAAFVLVAKEGAGYNPPACAPPNTFTDVPETSPFCKFIEELAARGVVAGCATNQYCPTSPVQRNQMAVFVLRTLDPTLNPPACTTPVFADVPASDPFCKWIEELARRNIVTGCGGGNYCPTSPVTRDQMGVFLSLTFGLTLYGL